MVKVNKVKPHKKKHREEKEERREKSSLADRIKPIGFGNKINIKLLLYGESGTGKTTLWSTFPGPILAITVKTSDEVEEFRSIDTPENRKKIKSFALEKSEELGEIIDEFGEDFETLVLDHVSGFQDKVLAEILGLDNLPEQKSWGLAQLQDYGQCTLQCKTHFRKLLNHNKNVVFVAHQKAHGTDDESSAAGLPARIGADLTGKLVNWLNGQVSYIGQMSRQQKEIVKIIEKKKKGKMVKIEKRIPTKGTDYMLRIGDESHFYMTKFRRPHQLGPIPNLIKNPTYDKILQLIKEKRV